jgi:hypothetical protein
MKKFAAVVTTALLAIGLTAVGVAAPASAHHSTVSPDAVCQTDGTYTVTWTYSSVGVTGAKEAETKVITYSPSQSELAGGTLKGGQLFLSVWAEHQVNVPGAPVKTGDWSSTFTQTKIPGTTKTATVMVQTDWKNGPSVDQSGTVNLNGDCAVAPKVAKAAVTTTPATCEAGEKLVYGDTTGAKLDGTANGTVGIAGGTAYDVSATATDGYKFPAGATTHWSGTLKGPDSTKCVPPPTCIPNSAIHYTYFPATNSGTVKVDDVKSVSGALCDPLYITATSWHYATNGTWPQKRDIVQKLPVITKPGSYDYAATVTCGQGDIYAAKGVLATWVDPTETLSGPGVEFKETFLSGYGFDGPKPTYTQTGTDCQTVKVVAPTASAITKCGTDGSLTVPANTYQVAYTVTGNGKTGVNVVTAVALHGATLVGYPTGGWKFDLGQRIECTQACTTVVDGGLSTDTHPNGWNLAATGDGHNDYTKDGLRIWTTSAGATSTGTHSASFPLSELGNPELTYLTTSGAGPALTVVIYDGGTKLGTLSRDNGAKTWNFDGTIAGIPSSGTIDSFRQAFANKGVTPTVKSIGYALGALGDGVITKIVVGCTSYTFTKEVLAPTLSVETGTCVADGNNSSKTVKFIFDNSTSNVDATFSIEGTTISELVKAGAVKKVDGPAAAPAGATYKVDVNGTFFQNLDVPAYDGCVVITPVDPTATPGTCVGGLSSNGHILITLDDRLTYAIHDADGKVLATDIADFAVGTGSYYVSVEAKPGYVLDPTVKTKWPLEVIVGGFTDCTAPTGAPTFTSLTCAPDTRNWAILPAVNGGVWEIARGDDKTVTTVASYEGGPNDDFSTFTASLKDANANDKYNVVEKTFDAWHPVDPAGLDCTLEGVVAATASSCDVPQPDGVTPTIWVHTVLRDDVTWTLDAGTADAKVITSEYTETTVGTHTVSAASNKPGYTLKGETSFTLSPKDTFACIPTLAILEADASADPQKCVSNSPTDGSLTFAFEAGLQQRLYYSVKKVGSTGSSTKVTTSSTTKTSITRVFPAGKYTVVAHPVDPAADSIDVTAPATDRWTLTIAAASAVCGTIHQLAFTGQTGALGMVGFMLAGGMIFLAAAAFFMRRRFGRQAL